MKGLSGQQSEDYTFDDKNINQGSMLPNIMLGKQNSLVISTNENTQARNYRQIARGSSVISIGQSNNKLLKDNLDLNRRKFKQL
jgi:hypothetical protein